MKKEYQNCLFVCFLLIVFVFTGCIRSQDDVIPFSSDRWEIKGGAVVEHLGREAFQGAAILKDATLHNGVIEVDVAVTGERSYPGLLFRMYDDANAERVYIRPHRAGLYPDAVQYTPMINKVSGWQLYHGDGYTAGVEMPTGRWVHLKIEVSGTQGHVYLDNAEKPVLRIHHLQNENKAGKLGVLGTINGTAYFSNFSYREDDSISFEPPPEVEPPAHVISEWEISKTYMAEKYDPAELGYPNFYAIFYSEWRNVRADESGLVDFSRYVKRTAGKPDMIFARTQLHSRERKEVRLSFGYSDEIAIFHNEKKIFYGNSSYQYRDKSFTGIVGFHDSVYLTLEPGFNEIYLILKESFGGWGITCKLDTEPEYLSKDHSRLEKVWETEAVFKTPESVLYDPVRKVLFISNYNVRYDPKETDPAKYNGFISKLKLDGTVEELKWVTNLKAPAGLAMVGDKLYTVERGAVVEIDVETATITQRYPVPESDFMNDVVADSEGTLYITDTRPSSHPDSCIFRFRDGVAEKWYDTFEIRRSNGIFLEGDELYVGNTGDGLLKSINVKSKVIKRISALGGGVLDGIRRDNSGNLLVSHWEGPVFSISPQGIVTEIGDLSEEQMNAADFEYLSDDGLLIVPTFLGNKVVAYMVKE